LRFHVSKLKPPKLRRSRSLKRLGTALLSSSLLLAHPNSVGAQTRQKQSETGWCREAYDWRAVEDSTTPSSSDAQNRRHFEAYVGRMALIMEREKLDEAQREHLRAICSAYVAGAADGTEHALRLVRETLSKR
jgi:hypothetical protein